MDEIYTIQLANVSVEEIEDAVSVLRIGVARIKTPWGDDIASWGIGYIDISLLPTCVQVSYCASTPEWACRGRGIFERLRDYLYEHHQSRRV